MPLYEYECKRCGVRFERLQKMADAPLTDCPECGGGVYRVIQPVGIIFKGSGFYVTDNKGKSSTGIPGKKKDEETKSGETTSSSTTEATKPATPPATTSSSATKND